MSVRESRAGDDFHLLWAARRAMGLLVPSTDLRVVRVEGPSPIDAHESDDAFLGCDVTEYYGGESFETAQRTCFAQLKYSSKHPGRSWTAARLSEKPTKGKPVIFRLAAMFKAVCLAHDAERVVTRLRVQLVSNQPLDEGLRSLLEAVVPRISETANPRWRDVDQQLTTAQSAKLKTLQKASGLPETKFLLFLRVLDLSGCGADSRLMQQLHLRRSVGSVLLDAPAQGLTGLLQLIREHTLPEHEVSRGLTKEDILVALGALGIASLFPYPAMIDPPPVLVPTQQAAVLASAVSQSTNRKLIAHGGLGIGKTTTLLHLEQQLPPNSMLISYDCYARGQYEHTDQNRHNPAALIQIANDLAQRAGMAPVLLPAGSVAPQILRDALERMLVGVSEVLDHDALGVIAVDAADNSALIANARNEPCFLELLWRIPVPHNIRILLTARTVRVPQILQRVGSKSSYDDVRLSGFDQAASASMLRSGFPRASSEACEQFHHNSSGVARVQRYALDASIGGTDQDAVAAATSSLEELFDDLLNTVSPASASGGVQDEVLAMLAVASKPIHAELLAAASGQSEGDIRRLLEGLHPAVLPSEDGFGFADEDFEAHLNARINPSRLMAAHAKFVTHLFPRRHSDRDAAARIAGHLDGSNEVERLVSLARDEGLPDVIADGFVRQAVYRTRVRLALRRRLAEPDARSRIETLELLLAAADASTSQETLTDTIRKAPDLAAIHGDPGAVAEVLASDRSEDWRGAAHMRAASVLASHPEHRERAEEHLRLAQAWIRAWMASSERDRGTFGPEDVAAAGFAQWLLSQRSVERTLADGWRPPRFARSAYEALIVRVASEATWQELEAILDHRRLSTTLRAHAVVAFHRRGGKVPKQVLSDLVARLSHCSPKAQGLWLLPLCSFGIEAGIAERAIRPVLEPRTPTLSHISEWDAVERLAPYLEAQLLLRGTRKSNATVDDLTPPAFEGKDQGSEARIYKQVGQWLLPVLEASLALSRASTRRHTREDKLRAACVVAVTAVSSSSPVDHSDPQRRRTYDGIARTGLALLAKAHRLAIGWGLTDAVDEVSSHIRSASATVMSNTTGAAGLLVGLASELSQQAGSGSLVVELLDSASRFCEELEIPAADKRDLLLRASEVAVKLREPESLVHSEDLFKRALVQAGSIDFDLASRLRALSDLVRQAPPPSPDHGDRHLARALVKAVVDAVPRVEDADRLPYRLALSAAARLDPETGLGSALRWADEQRTSLKNGLLAVLPDCIEREELTLWQALALHGLLPPEEPIIERLVSTLQAHPDEGTARSVLRRWQRQLQRRSCIDVQGRGSAAEAKLLLVALDQFQVGEAAVKNSLAEFIDSRPHLGRDESDDAGTLHWDGTRNESLKRRIELASQDRLEQDLAENADDYLPRSAKVAYLKQLVTKQQGGKVATLRLLAGLTRNDRVNLDPEIVAEVLTLALTTWSSSPDVQSWTLAQLPEWIAEHLPSLFRTDYDTYGQIERHFVPVSPRPEIRAAALTSAATQLEQLGTEELRALARYMGQGMTGSEVAAAIRWALAPDDAAASETTSQDPAGANLMTRVLLAKLGDEDARTRWLTCHVIRNIARHEGLAIVGDLLQAAFGHTPVSDAEFRMPGSHENSMTAKLWLLIALDGIAHEDPNALAPHMSALAEIARDTAFPHVVIRELARRILLTLPGLAPQDRESLELSNKPVAYSLTTGRHVSDHSDVKTRFKFRAWDTFRYVYQPLAERLENVDLDRLVTLTDAWISDTWHVTEEQPARSDPRRKRWQDEYRLTSNDHGAVPIIETRQQYYEFHALMCAAGQLIDEGVQAQRRFDSDTSDPWETWLDDYLPRLPWPGDARQEIPPSALEWITTTAIEPPIGLKAPEGSEPYAAQPELEPLAREAALSAFSHLDNLASTESTLLVNANMSFTQDKGYGWTSQTSALASPEAMRALFSVFPIAQGSLQVPRIGEHATDRWSDATELPGLSFTGWLTEERDESTTLSDSDPLRGDGSSLQSITMDQRLMKSASSARLSQWRSIDSRDPERRDVNDLHGHVLEIPREDLLEDLRMTSQCLVLLAHTHISRNRRHEQEPTLLLDADRLTVIWPDGREEVTYGRISGSFSRL